MDKLNLYRPLYLIVLIMSGVGFCTSYFVSKEYFVLWSIIWIITAAATLVRGYFISRDNKNYYKYLRNMMNSRFEKKGMDMPIPVVIISDTGFVLWSNQLFTLNIADDETNIFELLPNIDYTFEDHNEGYNVTVQGHNYTAFVIPIVYNNEKAFQLLFIDDHNLKQYSQLYFDTRPSVMIMQIDNYSEMFVDAKENERTKITGDIEHIIDAFADENHAFLRKVDKDKYVSVVEEKYMRSIIKDKFKILDNVRGVDVGEKMTPTLSIGVANTEWDLYKSEIDARQALDMALGRGGDQVAMKQKNGYEFYGGLSRGVEKRNKVRTRIVANAISETLKNCSNILLMGHRFSDLDCLGSSIGMCAGLRDRDKQINIVINKSKSLALSLYNKMQNDEFYSKVFISPQQAEDYVDQDTLLIILDTHVRDLLESPEIYDRCKNIIVIDHHRKMVNHIDNSIIFFHEPNASSASEMVTELVQYLAKKPDKISILEAEALLSGITLDTKNFTMRAGVRTFEAAAFLRKLGADTIEVRNLFASNIDDYKQRVRLVSSAEIYHNCAIASSEGVSDGEDIRIIASQAADELLTISNVDASFVMFETDFGTSISARSMGRVNVQLIMESLGGGGHQTMAAAQFQNESMENCRQKLLIAIEDYFIGTEEEK